MKKMIGMLGGLCLLAMVGGPAQAIVVNLTNDHCGGGCGPGGGAVLATVTLTDTADGVDFIVAVNPGYVFNLAGGAGLNTFSFSTNVALALTDFVGLPTGFNAILAPGNQDGFGTFGYSVNGTAVPPVNTFAGPIAFTVLGIDFSNFILSTGGDPSVFFAADLLGLVSGNTGLVGSGILTINPTGGPGDTPVPGAVWLFGSGLAGLAVLARRRKRAKQAA